MVSPPFLHPIIKLCRILLALPLKLISHLVHLFFWHHPYCYTAIQAIIFSCLAAAQEFQNFVSLSHFCCPGVLSSYSNCSGSLNYTGLLAGFESINMHTTTLEPLLLLCLLPRMTLLKRSHKPLATVLQNSVQILPSLTSLCKLYLHCLFTYSCSVPDLLLHLSCCLFSLLW